MKRKGVTENAKMRFLRIPDIKEYVSLLTEYRSNITGRYDGVVHLIPEAIASLQKRANEREIRQHSRGNTNQEKRKKNGLSYPNCESPTLPPKNASAALRNSY